jgi:hypothetical protein
MWFSETVSLEVVFETKARLMAEGLGVKNQY